MFVTAAYGTERCAAKAASRAAAAASSWLVYRYLPRKQGEKQAPRCQPLSRAAQGAQPTAGLG